MPKNRTILLSILASVLSLILLEGLLSWSYAVKKTWERSQPRRAEANHAEHDPELGWVNRPSVKLRNLYGPGRHFTTNSQRFRASEEYARAAPEGRTRVIFLGDSFTMGFGVDDTQTYPSLIEALNSSTQSINMGMGAYGVDQSYLWYRRDGVNLDVDVVVLSFISHDFERITMDHFISPKPRLELIDGKLIVQNVPIPAYSLNSRLRKAAIEFTYWLDIAKAIRFGIEFLQPTKSRKVRSQKTADNPDFPFAPIAEHIFKELADLCRKRGQKLLLVFLPMRTDLGRTRPVAEWVQRVAAIHGIPFVNLTPAFDALQSPERWEMFLADGHYSPAGNRLVAEALLPRIVELSKSSE